EFLSSGAKGKRVRFRPRHAHVEERLMQIEVVAVGGPRAAIATLLEAAFELGEEAEIICEMSIGMNHVALQQITVVILRPATPKVVVIILVTFAHLAAQGDVGTGVCSERNELESIEIVTASRRVAQ